MPFTLLVLVMSSFIFAFHPVGSGWRQQTDCLSPCWFWLKDLGIEPFTLLVLVKPCLYYAFHPVGSG